MKVDLKNMYFTYLKDANINILTYIEWLEANLIKYIIQERENEYAKR